MAQIIQTDESRQLEFTYFRSEIKQANMNIVEAQNAKKHLVSDWAETLRKKLPGWLTDTLCPDKSKLPILLLTLYEAEEDYEYNTGIHAWSTPFGKKFGLGFYDDIPVITPTELRDAIDQFYAITGKHLSFKKNAENFLILCFS